MDVAIGYSILIIIISIIGFMVNAFLIITIYRNIQQKTSFHFTLISLSCADTLATIGSTMYGLLYLHKSRLSADFQHLSTISLFFVYFSNLVSFMHIIFIAVLRAFASIFPLKFRTLCVGCHFFLVICSVWVFSIAFLLLVAFQVFHFLVIGYIGLATCVMLILLYLFICLYLRKQQQNSVATASNSRSQRPSIIVLLHSIAVTVAYIICVVPAAVYATLGFPGGFITFVIVTIFLVLNPVIDPMLYFFISHLRTRRLARPQNATPNERSTPQAITTQL